MGSELDAAEILKPALARGEIRVIGATTAGAYERTLARDPALARRFARVDVGEPAPAEALAMLRAAAADLAAHHGVTYDDDALAEAVALTARFLPDRCLPDKGLDALDHGAVRAVREGRARVTRDDVRAVVAALARVPLSSVRSGAGRLGDLAARLRAVVHGQDTACARVAEVLLVRGLGLGAGEERPRGVFLFVGPPGVGKTHFARALATALHGGPEHLVRIDMSELMERHEVARLLGAPAGYVGHEEGGMLTRALRDRPAAVVLLDEVDKAHPAVLDVFLQLFDAGRITDGRGETVDARLATFVMTCNLAEREGGTRLGFAGLGDTATREHETLARVRARFRPELLARVDAVLPFAPLSAEALVAIAREHLGRAVEALAREGIAVDVEGAVAEALARSDAVREQGARAIARAVEQQVVLPVVRRVLVDAASAVRVRVGEGGVEVG
jgi:ATP-dependent Clp protease ATP-binding subunit ClpA